MCVSRKFPLLSQTFTKLIHTFFSPPLIQCHTKVFHWYILDFIINIYLSIISKLTKPKSVLISTFQSKQNCLFLFQKNNPIWLIAFICVSRVCYDNENVYHMRNCPSVNHAIYTSRTSKNGWIFFSLLIDMWACVCVCVEEAPAKNSTFLLHFRSRLIII